MSCILILIISSKRDMIFTDECMKTLPINWGETTRMDGEHEEPKQIFDKMENILPCSLNGTEITVQQQAHGHDVRILRLYDRDELCSTIYADITEQTVAIENQPVSPIKTAFGNNFLPDWEDFQRFLAERCIPQYRAGLREYLEALGLEEYDPLAIIEKTGGRMAEDQQWLTIEVVK